MVGQEVAPDETAVAEFTGKRVVMAGGLMFFIGKKKQVVSSG